MEKNELMLAIIQAKLNNENIVIEIGETPFDTKQYVFKDFTVIADRLNIVIFDKETTIAATTTDIYSIETKETIKSLTKSLIETQAPQDEVFNEKLENVKPNIINKQIEDLKTFIDSKNDFKATNKPTDELLNETLENILGTRKIVKTLNTSEIDALYKKALQLIENYSDLPF